MIAWIAARLLGLIQSAGYRGLGFAMAFESIFPFIPSELIIPFGGFLASQGVMTIPEAIIASIIGTYIGMIPVYLLGYWSDEERVMAFIARYGKYFFVTTKAAQRWFAFFEKYGYGFVFFGRFIPIVRAVVSIPAGSVKMNFWRYTLYTLLGCTVWGTILVYAGYELGQNRETLTTVMGHYEHLAIALLIILFVIYILRHIIRKIKKTNKKVSSH